MDSNDENLCPQFDVQQPSVAALAPLAKLMDVKMQLLQRMRRSSSQVQPEPSTLHSGRERVGIPPFASKWKKLEKEAKGSTHLRELREVVSAQDKQDGHDGEDRVC